MNGYDILQERMAAWLLVRIEEIIHFFIFYLNAFCLYLCVFCCCFFFFIEGGEVTWGGCGILCFSFPYDYLMAVVASCVSESDFTYKKIWSIKHMMHYYRSHYPTLYKVVKMILISVSYIKKLFTDYTSVIKYNNITTM